MVLFIVDTFSRLEKECSNPNFVISDIRKMKDFKHELFDSGKEFLLIKTPVVESGRKVRVHENALQR